MRVHGFSPYEQIKKYYPATVVHPPRPVEDWGTRMNDRIDRWPWTVVVGLWVGVIWLALKAW